MFSLEQVMAWYPNKRLYKRPSSKSGKDIISVYRPQAPCPVYSHAEWYADDWQSPFIEVDMEKSFFRQFAELQKITPVIALLSNKQENAEYCQDVDRLKNCYLVFDAISCEDVYYSARIYNSRSCIDCYWILDSELLYECVYAFNSYNSRYSFNCKGITDSAFLFNCRSSRNCFMSSNLRNKQFYIRNRPYTETEYHEFMAQLDLSDPGIIHTLKNEFNELIKNTPIPPAFLDRIEQAEGNYLRGAKSVKDALESFDVEHCEMIFQCGKGKDIVGSFMCNDNVEQCYQCVATGINSFNTKNCAFTWGSSNMEYTYLCINCKDCFGCIGLRNKQFYIFNKAYSKAAYNAVKAKLIAVMQKFGEYGHFFPRELSPFPYEDTIAYDFFAEASTTPSVLLNLIPQERKFYADHGIPEPTLSFSTRYRERLNLMDTSFTQKNGTYYKHPETKHIVSQDVYEQSLLN